MCRASQGLCQCAGRGALGVRACTECAGFCTWQLWTPVTCGTDHTPRMPMLVRLLSPAAGCSLRLLCPGSGDGVGSSTSPRCPFCSGKQLFWQQQQGTGSPAWEVPPALPAPLSLQSSQRKGMGLVVHKVVTEHPTLIPGIAQPPRCAPLYSPLPMCVCTSKPLVCKHIPLVRT